MVNSEKIKMFLWNCIVINFIILILLSPIVFFSDAVYQIHSQWFKASNEEFVTYLYYVIAFYKLMWIFFNIVPYIALRMLYKKSS